MLRKIAGECSDGVTCPAAWDDEDGTVIVQGYQAVVADLPPAPDGEARVRVPREVLLQAARELQ